MRKAGSYVLVKLSIKKHAFQLLSLTFEWQLIFQGYEDSAFASTKVPNLLFLEAYGLIL